MRFIPQSGTPLGSLEWETAAVVSADGSQRALDSAAALPPLEEGESYQFSLTLPENRTRETRLMFDAGGLEAAVYLDEQQVWYSVALASMEGSELGPVQLTLPVGGGETFTMVLRPAPRPPPFLSRRCFASRTSAATGFRQRCLPGC